jgi:hypothetical protein
MITGNQLRDARVRAGYRTQKQLAAALAVSLRTITGWEGSKVPAKEELRVLELLWPGRSPLAAIDDLALITELGRRLAEYKRDQTVAETPSDLDDLPSRVLNNVPAGTFTGRRGDRILRKSTDEASDSALRPPHRPL